MPGSLLLPVFCFLLRSGLQVIQLFFLRFGHPFAILVKPAIENAEQQSTRLFLLSLQFYAAFRVATRPQFLWREISVVSN